MRREEDHDMAALFQHPDHDFHESVLFARDRESGLKAIIAIHDTTLGPALGGCRIWSYDSEAEAVRDALRLSRGMSYKNALAGLALGGGKSVIMIERGKPKSKPMLRAFGRAVERLGGAYITAEDVGSSPKDMDAIGQETAHVAGRSDQEGDPSPFTADGVFRSLRAAVETTLKSDLKGVRVAVKGLGHVGMSLCRKLREAGAELQVADIRKASVKRAVDELGAAALAPDAAHAAEAEVFAPCALGGDLNRTAIREMKARIVCGAANNQLESPEDDQRLSERGVVYCPDYLVNAGGVIAVSRKTLGLSDAAVEAKLAEIPKTLTEVLAAARKAKRPTGAVADALALARFRPETAS